MNCAEVFKKRSKLKVWFDSRFCPLNVSLVSLAAVSVSSHKTKTASKETKCEFNLLIAEVFFQILTLRFPFSTIPCDQGTKVTCSSFKRLLFYVIHLLSWMKSTTCLLPCGALQDSGNFRLRKWSFFKAFSVLILAFFVVFVYFSGWIFNFNQHLNGALDLLFSEVFGFKQTELGSLKGWIALGFFGCFAVSNMAQLVKCFAYHKNVTCGIH